MKVITEPSPAGPWILCSALEMTPPSRSGDGEPTARWKEAWSSGEKAETLRMTDGLGRRGGALHPGSLAKGSRASARRGQQGVGGQGVRWPAGAGRPRESRTQLLASGDHVMRVHVCVCAHVQACVSQGKDVSLWGSWCGVSPAPVSRGHQGREPRASEHGAASNSQRGLAFLGGRKPR